MKIEYTVDLDDLADFTRFHYQYHWRIKLNWPKEGELSFGAVGYTQTLLAEPLLSAKQHLSLKERSRRTGR